MLLCPQLALVSLRCIARTTPVLTRCRSIITPAAAVYHASCKTAHRKSKFFGQAYTIKTREDNGIVRKTLEKPGENRVLCVDGGGSWRCALVGDQLAKLVEKNGWAGVIVYGVIRDSDEINQMDVSIRALGTSPVKSIRREWGVDNIPAQFEHDPAFSPGDWIYADNDGILLSKKKLV